MINRAQALRIARRFRRQHGLSQRRTAVQQQTGFSAETPYAAVPFPAASICQAPPRRKRRPHKMLLQSETRAAPRDPCPANAQRTLQPNPINPRVVSHMIPPPLSGRIISHIPIMRQLAAAFRDSARPRIGIVTRDAARAYRLRRQGRSPRCRPPRPLPPREVSLQDANVDRCRHPATAADVAKPDCSRRDLQMLPAYALPSQRPAAGTAAPIRSPQRFGAAYGRQQSPARDQHTSRSPAPPPSAGQRRDWRGPADVPPRPGTGRPA